MEISEEAARILHINYWASPVETSANATHSPSDTVICTWLTTRTVSCSTLEWVDLYSDSHSNSDARTRTKSCEYTTVFTAILETSRLRLREMVEADVQDVYLLNSSPNVMKYLGAEHPLSSLDEALALLRVPIVPQYQSSSVGRWAVIMKDNSRIIGWCGLKYHPAANEYDLRYRFIQDYWGNGYDTEVALGVLEYCRQHLTGKRIVGK